jgi:hypothetical protein
MFRLREESMIKRGVAFLTVAALFLVAVSAEGAERGWWQGLFNKVERITPRKRSFTTAVGGVRGAQKDISGQLYWKGRERDIVVDEEELELFKDAFDKAVEGEAGKALDLFSTFVEKYPESPMREDALNAIMKLQATPEEAKTEAPPLFGVSEGEPPEAPPGPVPSAEPSDLNEVPGEAVMEEEIGPPGEAEEDVQGEADYELGEEPVAPPQGMALPGVPLPQ